MMMQIDNPFIDFRVKLYHPQLKKVGELSLQSLLKKKQWAVIFFYPADFTFVCPTELADLAKRYKEFKALNCEIYGISTDTVYTHKMWLETEHLLEGVGYPLLADHNGAFAKSLGIYEEGSGMAARAAYIVDPKGILRSIQIVADNIGRSAGEILRQVKALKYVAENPGVACPASWDTGSQVLTPDISISGKVFESLHSKKSHRG